MRGALAALALLASTPAAAQPSFDCARASTAVERTICATPALHALDAELATLYRAVQDRPGARDAQRGWVRARDERCGKVPEGQRMECVAQAYRARITELRAAVPDAKPAVWPARARFAERGFSGGLTLRAEGDGWLLSASSAADAPPHPTCQIAGVTLRAEGAGTLRGVSADGGGVTLTRSGEDVVLALDDPFAACGLNGRLHGRYTRN